MKKWKCSFLPYSACIALVLGNTYWFCMGKHRDMAVKISLCPRREAETIVKHRKKNHLSVILTQTFTAGTVTSHHQQKSPFTSGHLLLLYIFCQGWDSWALQIQTCLKYRHLILALFGNNILSVTLKICTKKELRLLCILMEYIMCFIINIEQKVNINIGQFEEFQFP